MSSSLPPFLPPSLKKKRKTTPKTPPSFFGSFLSFSRKNTTHQNMAGLVELATSDKLIGPDWGRNLEICDVINYHPGQAQDVVKAINKRLSIKNAEVQLLALTVLEMVMKNCGELVHQIVAEKDVLHKMVKIVKKADMGVRDKILVLLDSWQEAFGGPLGRYPQYYTAYDELRRSGVEFPQQNPEGAVPMFTPPPTHPSPLGYGSPADASERLVEMMTATENPVWSARDMDGARRGLEVLDEMLNALDPGDKQAVEDDVIMQLVEQCRTNQRSIMQLVNSTLDESLLCQGLVLNDDLQRVLAKHNDIMSGSLMLAEHMSGSSRGLAVHDQEEDEPEDELSQLAHRSSSRSSHTSAHIQENRSPSNTQYAVPPLLQPIKKLNTPLSATGGQTLDLSRELLDEVASPATLATQVMASTTNLQASLPNSEQLSALNPFADSASFSVTSSRQAFPPVTGSGRNMVPSLPPPPMLYTERERFFEEKRQTNQGPQSASITPSSLDQRTWNLTLQNAGQKQDAPIGMLAQPATSFQLKQASPSKKEVRSADRLCKDLVDLRTLSTKFKMTRVLNSFSRPNASRTGGM